MSARASWAALLLFLSVPAIADETITPTGLAPVRIGMTRSEAEAASGAKLHLQGADSASIRECATADRPDHKAWYMFRKDRVVRIDVEKKGITTLEGIGVGSSEVAIRKAYGRRAKFSPHPYGNGTGDSHDWHYVMIHFPASHHDLLFETDSRRVTSFRIGTPSAVSLSEGCS